MFNVKYINLFSRGKTQIESYNEYYYNSMVLYVLV